MSVCAGSGLDLCRYRMLMCAGSGLDLSHVVRAVSVKDKPSNRSAAVVDQEVFVVCHIVQLTFDNHSYFKTDTLRNARARFGRKCRSS